MAHNGITEVGKYRVIEQVGEGAMGVVYRALDPVLNRTVAIKVMSDALARDDELRGRFLREAQAAGSLQHPNVITIYDFGEVGGHLYIAMEFVAGSDLEDTLKGGLPLSIVQKIDILVDVLNGLGYAHKRGVVHRDIKPANIRLDEEGRARIMDFGIAHLQSSTLTRSGLMVGTPAYMAPEQVSGGAISAQTDVFSVGAVMYELFTGSKPFEGESLQSVFYKIVTQPPLDFAAVAPNLPASLNRIVMRALAKAPSDRYPSAADMANELSEARGKLDRMSSMPTRVSLNSSLATGLSARSTKPMPVVRDRSRIIVAASAGAVAVVASVGIFLSMRSREPELPPAATTPAPAVTQAPLPLTPPAPQVAVAPPVTQSAAPAPAAKTADRTPTKAERPAPTAQELSLFRSLQAATLESRRRASEAGASADQLRAGDNHNTLANSSLQGSRITEAMAHLNLASTSWTTAERDARAAAAAAAAAQAKTRAAEQKPQETPPVVPPPTTTATAPATVAAPPPVTSSPRPATNPVVEIEAVIVAYQRAIETRDVAELRRAYPGMTAAQAKGWEDFFKTLRSIQTALSPLGVDVRGDAADARITGAYDYVTTAGKSVRQPVNFQASFRREGGAWRLIAVR